MSASSSSSSSSAGPAGDAGGRLSGGLVRLIARREITVRLQQRSFRIGVGVTLLLVALVVVLPGIIHGSSSKPLDIGVAGGDTTTLASQLTTAAVERGASVRVHPTTAADAEAKVRAGTWAAALVDDRRVFAGSATSTAVAVVQQAHQAAAVQQRLSAAGLSPGQISSALSVPGLPVSSTSPPENTKRQAFATVAVVLLFGQLITYCTWVATGVVEEKTSRVVELLLSAVRPLQLLAGKLLGIGALAVAQVALLGVLALAAGGAAHTVTGGADAYGAVAVAFVGFVLGFAVFATLAAALASTVSRQEELSGVLLPVNLVLMLSYFGSLAAASSPDRPFARVLSMVPPVSALTMPARWARGSVPVLDLIVAVVLLVALAAVMLVVAARIYRAAVLHTGNRVSLRRAWRGEAVAELA